MCKKSGLTIKQIFAEAGISNKERRNYKKKTLHNTKRNNQRDNFSKITSFQ